jgi:carbamoyltransferase
VRLLSIYYFHNSVVGVAEEGHITALVHEERLTRVKNITGVPLNALDYVIKNYFHYDRASIPEFFTDDVTRIAVLYFHGLGWKPFPLRERSQRVTVAGLTKRPAKKASFDFRGLIRPHLQKVKDFIKYRVLKKDPHHKPWLDQIDQLLLDHIGMPKAQVRRLLHHDAHAWAAVPWLGQKKALIFTSDGVGDMQSSSVKLWDGNTLTTLSANPYTASLGIVYSYVTLLMGMSISEHEFKVMGLAPYAASHHAERIARRFWDVLWLDEQGAWKSTHDLFELNPRFVDLIFGERFDNIAGGVQLFTEQFTTKWVKYWVEKTGIRTVALSGGTFMNIKANKCIGELPEVEELVVVPSAGDESLPIGHLTCASYSKGIRMQPLEHLYLGTDCRETLDTALQSLRQRTDVRVTSFTSDEELAEKIAEILAGGGIVGVCYGREEWGARALGHRSILADPRSFQTIQVLNDKIKCRDFWMPFAPAILAERAQDYFSNPKNIHAPFMNMSFDSTPLGRRELQAAVHPRDGTLRSQIVTQQHTPFLYKIVKAFERRTGVGGVLNTSFNLHGEPNVCTCQDAIYTLDNSGLNYVTLHNHLVEKIPPAGKGDLA